MKKLLLIALIIIVAILLVKRKTQRAPDYIDPYPDEITASASFK